MPAIVSDELFFDSSLGIEYEKALLLNYFSKLCVRMKEDASFYTHVLKLFRQTFDKSLTTKILFNREFDFDLSDSQCYIVSKWINAFFKKSEFRKSYPDDYKKLLIMKQNNICPICHRTFDSDLSKIHIDHIIPWKFVGDELDDNYQCLCDSCNKRKNDSIDYIFKSLLNLI